MTRAPLRLPDYDYRTPGAYFITICTWRRLLLFEDDFLAREVESSWRSVGKYVRGVWNDTFVVMPNHIHGIIWLRADPTASTRSNLEPAGVQLVPISMNSSATDRSSGEEGPLYAARAAPLHPSDERTAPLQRPEDRIPPGSLGAVVRAFKSLSTKRVNARRGTPGAKVWQRGYHEEVIRDEAGLARVREYILHNPVKWELDPLNPRR